jgi:6-phosphogluconate dehydrogenase
VCAIPQTERVKASTILKGPQIKFTGDRQQLINDIRDAIFASKIVSYAQGYLLMRAAAREYKWNLNYGGIALMWRGGCIIRSKFLGNIKEAFTKQPNLENLLFDPYFVQKVTAAQVQHKQNKIERSIEHDFCFATLFSVCMCVRVLIKMNRDGWVDGWTHSKTN